MPGTPNQSAPISRTAGIATEVEPGVTVVTAPNASPMTFRGTNTWIVGDAQLAVIDPGPLSPSHFDAILSTVRGRKVCAILVTHAHVDHSPLAARLARETGASVMAFGTPTAGQAPHMAELAATGLAGGGEGVDHDFSPDVLLGDGDVVDVGNDSLQALHTPGHMSNHLCFALVKDGQPDAVFTGDHVMGWASSLVSPPDGDLTAFMASCERLSRRPDRIYYAGHGDPVTDPAARLSWLIAHRKSRETQILGVLDRGAATAAEICKEIYSDINPALLPAAERNVLAHLIDLTQRDLAYPHSELSSGAVFELSPGPY